MNHIVGDKTELTIAIPAKENEAKPRNAYDFIQTCEIPAEVTLSTWPGDPPEING